MTSVKQPFMSTDERPEIELLEVRSGVDFAPQPDLARLDQLSPRTQRRTDRYTRHAG